MKRHAREAGLWVGSKAPGQGPGQVDQGLVLDPGGHWQGCLLDQLGLEVKWGVLGPGHVGGPAALRQVGQGWVPGPVGYKAACWTGQIWWQNSCLACRAMSPQQCCQPIQGKGGPGQGLGEVVRRLGLERQRALVGIGLVPDLSVPGIGGCQTAEGAGDQAGTRTQ